MVEKLENMVENYHNIEHGETFASFDHDFGVDKPLDRWDTYLEDKFENWDLLHAEKNEYSDTSMKLPKIFSWTATGSFSFARSLGKSLLDFFR